MTTPAPEALEREQDKLWVTDAELIRRLGVPEKIARATIRVLDRQPSGFPKKEKLWGDRRYWPQSRNTWIRSTVGGAHDPTEDH